MNRVPSARLCSHEGCKRPAAWQPVLYVPVTRAEERDVVAIVLPIVFCARHHLSTHSRAKMEESKGVKQAVARRIDHGWQPAAQRSWVQRTPIVDERG